MKRIFLVRLLGLWNPKTTDTDTLPVDMPKYIEMEIYSNVNVQWGAGEFSSACDRHCIQGNILQEISKMYTVGSRKLLIFNC